MARTSTLYNFDIEIADIDRGVYETVSLRVPQHPSEEEARLLTRIVARVLLCEPDLEFGRGLSHTEEPALWTRDAQQNVMRWVDVGAPSAERLHRASKLAKATHVVTTKNATNLRREWSKRAIAGADTVEIIELAASFVDALVATLDRRNHWYATIQDEHLQVLANDNPHGTSIKRGSLVAFLDAQTGS